MDAKHLRERALQSIDDDALDPVVGPGAHRRHDRQPARLVHLAPARLGRADPGDGLHEVRHAGADQGARRQGRVGVRRLRRRRLVRAAGRGVHPRRDDVRRVRRHRIRARGQHPRRLVRFGLEPRGGAAVPRGSSLAGRHLSRRQRSASRLVPQLAARRHRHARPRAVQPGADARLRDGREGPQDVEVARQHHRAAGRHQAERLGDPAPVGVDGGLPLRHQHRQGSAGAHGRELSQDPQRDPRAGRQPLRLRSERRRRAEGEDARDRSLGARASTPTPRRRSSRPTRTTTTRRSSRSRTS